MTPDQRAALDRAKGPQKHPLRFHMPGQFKKSQPRDYRDENDGKRRRK
ncbi:hypothetical protein Murka_0058 [Xanthomonas phage Murka]|nr:hypothetical protein Murka_0058 [Xanthomonas phage Murka]